MSAKRAKLMVLLGSCKYCQMRNICIRHYQNKTDKEFLIEEATRKVVGLLTVEWLKIYRDNMEIVIFENPIDFEHEVKKEFGIYFANSALLVIDEDVGLVGILLHADISFSILYISYDKGWAGYLTIAGNVGKKIHEYVKKYVADIDTAWQLLNIDSYDELVDTVKNLLGEEDLANLFGRFIKQTQ